MVDRLLVWFGAGVVAVGVTAGMITGTGLAVADDGSTSDGGGSTSESSNSAADQRDSTGTGLGGDTAGAGPDANSTEGSDTTDGKTSGETSGEVNDEPGPDEGSTDDEGSLDDEGTTDGEGSNDDGDADVAETDEDVTTNDDTNTDGDVATKSRSGAASGTPAAGPTSKAAIGSDRRVTLDVSPDEKPALTQDDDTTEDAVNAAAEARTVVPLASLADDIEDGPEVQAVAFASAAPELAANATATAPPLTALLDLVGTVVFNLYAVAIRLVGGPPVLPPNSSVTVRSSTLVLECGCDEGYTVEVPADWYIPAGAEDNPPERLIHLQHGFLAAGPWYSHTAAALAEQTNSIVVAPSITSNFLDADACWLGAPPMHEAIAGLYADGNTALAQSALAAGYAGPIPSRVVLMGHSLGGGAVIGAAGFMAGNDSIDRLAGVVLLDGVPLADGAVESINDVPDDIPIYQLAAPEYFWNQFGVGSDALLEARPDHDFIGVTLVGGSHVDTMRGGNPLIQFAQQLVSGFSKPQNVAAAEILMVGWVNDMFDPTTPEGIYLEPGEEFVLDTPAGEAVLVALPNSLTKPFLFNFLQPFVSLGDNIFTFEPACVTESIGTATAGSCGESIAA